MLQSSSIIGFLLVHGTGLSTAEHNSYQLLLPKTLRCACIFGGRLRVPLYIEKEHHPLGWCSFLVRGTGLEPVCSLRQTDFQPPFGAPKIGALPCGAEKHATGMFFYAHAPMPSSNACRAGITGHAFCHISKRTPPVGVVFFFGARYRTRTCDPMHVKHVLYQLS